MCGESRQLWIFFFFFCEGSILEASCSGCGGSKVITDVRVASGVRTSPLKGGGLSEGAALLDFGFPLKRVIVSKGGLCPQVGKNWFQRSQ